MSRAPGRINSNGISDRALDVLRTDGGWVDYQHVALQLRADPETVRKHLRRMRLMGHVEWRKPLDHRGEPLNRYDSRRRGEWRAK